MKKNIANTIKACAAKLPTVFEWEDGETVMKGWELNLTPLADKKKFIPDHDYLVPVPQLRAVTHEQQLKDAWKKEGSKGMIRYMDQVIEKAKQGVAL